MKKNKEKFLCCEKCFYDICKLDIPTARIWIRICDIYEKVKSNVFSINIPDFEELRILENNGFLVTTETNEELIVKLNGVRNDNAGTYFCIRDSHDD